MRNTRANCKRLAFGTFGLNVIDGIATRALVLEHGSKIESNPLMRAAVDQFGVNGFVGIKLTLAGTALWLLYETRREKTLAVWFAVYLVVVMLQIALRAGT